MYRLLRNSVEEKPGQGWDNPPKQDNISTADDIERIHQSRNFICHTDASEIETTVFNNKVLDLLGVMHFRKLAKGIFTFLYFKSKESLKIFQFSLVKSFSFLLTVTYDENTNILITYCEKKILISSEGIKCLKLQIFKISNVTLVNCTTVTIFVSSRKRARIKKHS